MSKKDSSELTAALMKKHLTLYNKMVRAETYKGVAKMKVNQVREIFKRDFRKTESGKDGKTFYPPRSYDIEINSMDNFTDALKALSKDLPINKPKEKKIIKVKRKKIIPPPPRKIIKKETASQKRARGIAGEAEALQEDALILLEENRAALEKIPVMIKNEKGKRVPDPSGNNFYKNKKEKISSKSFLDGSYKMRIDRAKREVKAIKKQIEKIAAKEESSNLLDDLKKFTNKYNANEIKKQNLTKQNLKNYTNPYFDLLEKIEKKLDNLDDKIEFLKDNKKLSTSFIDIKKNFVRRVKAQLKKSK